MTSPNIGSAEVDVNAYVDEKELADAARRAGRRAGDSAGDTFLSRFVRRLRRAGNSLFASLTEVAGQEGRHSADTYTSQFTRQLRRRLVSVDRVAVDAGRRFIRRFQSGLTRIRDFSLLDVAAVEVGARNAARRFRDTFTGTVGRLDGPDFDFAGPATAGGRSAAGRFVSAFRAAFGRGRLADGDAFSQVLGDQAAAERAAQAGGVRLGTRFARGFRGAILRVGDAISNLATPRFTGDPERDAEIAGRESANRFTRGFRSALERSDLGRQIALDFDRRGLFGGAFRAGIRLFGAFNRGLLALAGGGLKAFGGAISAVIRPFSRYIALFGLLTAVAVPLIPLIGRLANGLLDIVQGGLVAIPALLTAAAGSFFVFRAGAEGLSTALRPLSAAFEGFNEQISAVFLRGGIATAATRFATEQVPSIRRGLEQLAEGYSTFIARALDAGAVTRFGDVLERSFTSMRGFLDNLAFGLEPLADLVGQMVEQVSARLPRLGAELATFLTNLRDGARDVDFGEIFETGLRGAINLGAAIGQLTLAIGEFFEAAVGGDRNSSQPGSEPFEGLRESMGDLREWIDQNRGEIYGFFQGLGEVVGQIGRGARAAGTFLRDVFEPIREYVQSDVFAERMERISEAFERFGADTPEGEGLGSQIGDILVALADTILEDGPEIINFLEDARDLFLEVTPAIELLADEADGLGTAFAALGAVASAITQVSQAVDAFDVTKLSDVWRVLNTAPDIGIGPEAGAGGRRGIAQIIGDAIGNFDLQGVLTVFRTQISGLWSSLMGLFPSFDWGAIGRGIIRLILGPFSAPFLVPPGAFTTALSGLFSSVLAYVGGIDWGAVARTAVRLFTGPWAVPILLVAGSFTGAISRLFTSVFSFAQGISWASVARTVVALFTGGFNIGVFINPGGFTGALARLLGAIMTRARGISWASIGRTVISLFVNGFNFNGVIGGGLVSALSGLYLRLRGLASSISNIRISLPSVPGLGSLNRLPGQIANGLNGLLGRRANGGFINRPEVSLIGEAGPELVLPLSRPKRTQQLLREAGLSATSTHRTEIHAPITVMGGAGSDPLSTANLVSRKLMGKVR